MNNLEPCEPTKTPIAANILEDYRERVIYEKAELDMRILRLDSFLRSERSDAVPSQEIARMARQVTAMTEYSNILGERIQHFLN